MPQTRPQTITDIFENDEDVERTRQMRNLNDLLGQTTVDYSQFHMDPPEAPQQDNEKMQRYNRLATIAAIGQAVDAVGNAIGITTNPDWQPATSPVGQMGVEALDRIRGLDTDYRRRLDRHRDEVFRTDRANRQLDLRGEEQRIRQEQRLIENELRNLQREYQQGQLNKREYARTITGMQRDYLRKGFDWNPVTGELRPLEEAEITSITGQQVADPLEELMQRTGATQQELDLFDYAMGLIGELDPQTMYDTNGKPLPGTPAAEYEEIKSALGTRYYLLRNYMKQQAGNEPDGSQSPPEGQPVEESEAVTEQPAPEEPKPEQPPANTTSADTPRVQVSSEIEERYPLRPFHEMDPAARMDVLRDMVQDISRASDWETFNQMVEHWRRANRIHLRQSGFSPSLADETIDRLTGELMERVRPDIAAIDRGRQINPQMEEAAAERTGVTDRSNNRYESSVMDRLRRNSFTPTGTFTGPDGVPYFEPGEDAETQKIHHYLERLREEESELQDKIQQVYGNQKERLEKELASVQSKINRVQTEGLRGDEGYHTMAEQHAMKYDSFPEQLRGEGGEYWNALKSLIGYYAYAKPKEGFQNFIDSARVLWDMMTPEGRAEETAGQTANEIVQTDSESTPTEQEVVDVQEGFAKQHGLDIEYDQTQQIENVQSGKINTGNNREPVRVLIGPQEGSSSVFLVSEGDNSYRALIGFPSLDDALQVYHSTHPDDSETRPQARTLSVSEFKQFLQDGEIPSFRGIPVNRGDMRLEIQEMKNDG